MSVPVLRLYTRQDCHLCDEMKDGLRTLESEFKFKLEVHNIDSNKDMRTQFNDLVPVLMWGQDIICYHYLDKSALSKALGRH